MIWERVFTKSLHINLLKYIMGVANKKIHQGLYRVTRISASKLTSTWTAKAENDGVVYIT